MATLADYGPEVRAEVKQVREVVAALHEQLIKWNLVVWTAGNVSQRLRTADLMVIKPSGLRYEYLTPSSMVVCDLDGNVVDGAESPSSDTASHAYIYRHMPEVYGVVHTHSTYATAWAATGQNIPCGLTMMGDEFGGPVPVGPFRLIGSEAIGEGVVETLKAYPKSPAVLMQNHGPFTIGKDAEAAVKAAAMTEEVAHTMWAAKQLGDIIPIPQEDIDKLAEKQKKQFAGCEIMGKKLGIIGLGAIGAMVANAASALGMEVYGYDPYISIDAAWNLSRTIKHIKSLDEIYSQCDYITIHVPLLDSTKEMINKEALDKMKDGVVLLNFARDLLVDEDALIEALDSGKVKKYVTDFANHTVAGHKGILVTPHLGASTEESEENCAVMAVKEVRDFLENGNIKNSVNFPNCDMGTCVAVGRIAICHKNIPNMISQFTKILGAEGLNIADMTNKSKGEYAYTLIDLESAASREALDELKAIEGVSRVRVVK